jgi:hypothetical protein
MAGARERVERLCFSFLNVHLYLRIVIFITNLVPLPVISVHIFRHILSQQQA